MAQLLTVMQILLSLIVGVYFFRQLRRDRDARPARCREARAEAEHVRRLRSIRLSRPLNEAVRPRSFDEIVGQEEGVRALKAVLCGENPQHVLIYGPPGVGKTCAARLALEAAKRSAGTPFREDAPFVEMDATCLRFDERAIADPLFGSVHDPIYQGAGPLGQSGVPQPKEGAVTRAHGGILFLDEIGEMHPVQMNKLLKVLEDRIVRFDSAYYDPTDEATPAYIHDIFQNGLPADFRLIGATTRGPADIPPALRSRCMEIYFRPLEREELALVAENAARRAGYALSGEDAALVAAYADSARTAVNLVQLAAATARQEERRSITRADVEYVAACSRRALAREPQPAAGGTPGQVNALAVSGAEVGAILRTEAVARAGCGIPCGGQRCKDRNCASPALWRKRKFPMAAATVSAALERRATPPRPRARRSPPWACAWSAMMCTSTFPAERWWTAPRRALPWPWPCVRPSRANPSPPTRP